MGRLVNAELVGRRVDVVVGPRMDSVSALPSWVFLRVHLMSPRREETLPS
jgi:hypothetical protein